MGYECHGGGLFVESVTYKKRARNTEVYFFNSLVIPNDFRNKIFM